MWRFGSNRSLRFQRWLFFSCLPFLSWELSWGQAPTPREAAAYELPEQMMLCGERVPLEDPMVRRRIEQEFLLLLDQRGQLALWMRRAQSVFPAIHEVGRAGKRCEELRYIAVLESGLRAGVESRAKAKGWWQFMADTARDFSLRSSKNWDERASLKRSSAAAFRYLHRLHKRFGCWALALAAYNTGPGRLSRAQKNQRERRYWHLALYREAERYVPKYLAIKEILGNPEHYGLDATPRVAWRALKSRSLSLWIPKGQSQSLLKLALAAKVNYRALRELNPETVGTQSLPTQTEFSLQIPYTAFARFSRMAQHSGLVRSSRPSRQPSRQISNLPHGSTRARERARRSPERGSGRISVDEEEGGSGERQVYKIQAGDSLWLIARKVGVSVGQLRRWNLLTPRSILVVGQTLWLTAPEDRERLQQSSAQHRRRG